MPNNKPLPKSQQQLSQDSIKTYGVEAYSGSKQPINDLKKRELQRSVKDDNVKQFTLGLRDIDESIFYYFNNVIKPSVMQNNAKKNVPVLYGSPERWHSVQKEGFYRDRNGKIQLPLIMVKRDSIETSVIRWMLTILLNLECLKRNGARKTHMIDSQYLIIGL
jgi:hypothetical protein